ncbi:hypothetical protein [Krasilnikoviella flava]|uniref:hypothetical protein n=1 Tax=Krasilnikoviella flava TaxID=526729 RepID=UPI00111C3328|nr:hypothetical protein [Krasilnikoviella flava]
MDSIWDFLGSYWWLVFPLSGIVGGWIRGAQVWDERRRKDKLEMYRLKHADAQAAQVDDEALTSEIERTLSAHDDTQRRWLEYELDAVKALEYPLMQDMREQVTVDFHRARRAAEDLRPDDVDELRVRRRLDRYRDAVREMQVRFDVAEREAKRRRASDFSPAERQALDRAKKLLALADDEGSSQAERQSAYRRAMKELEGIVVLPDAATDALEQRIAGLLGPVPRDVARDDDAAGGAGHRPGT